MTYSKSSLVLVFTLIFYASYGQNLPSLLTHKNINATFSILAYDHDAKEWGIAVATNNIYVGNSTIYIEPGVGAFSVIAETEPNYGIIGLENLKAGNTIKQSINAIRHKDSESHYRQVSGIDAQGNAFAFTGHALKYWNGNASEIIGENYVVMGNQLADNVLLNMSNTFENSKGTLAERLLKSLIAGQDAGGQISGKQSAAIVVKGLNNDWYNQIDLRVDHSKKPIEDLQTLMNYHYGRIRLNQSNYAYKAGNLDRAKQKLIEAESMLNGWTGIYSKIARMHVLLGHEASAISWIQRGLAENPNWSVNLPAFYFLRNHPELSSLIKPDTFTIKDWENALAMLSTLEKELEAISLANELLDKHIESSYLHFLLGRSYFFEKENGSAIKHLKKALDMDPDNIEAQKLLKKL